MRGDECLVSLLGTSSHGWREGKKTEHKTYSGKKDQVQRWQESTRREPSWMMMSQNIPSPNNAEQGITFPMPVFKGIRLRHGTIQLVQKKKNTFINSQEAKLESKSRVPLSSAPAHCPLERSFLVPYTPTQALPLFFPSPPLCCGSSVHALCRCYPGYSPCLFFCKYQL